MLSAPNPGSTREICKNTQAQCNAPSSSIISTFIELLANASSMDDVYLIITNDIRAIIPFDRAFFLTHVGKKSRFIAANNIIAPENKSKFYTEASALSKGISELNKSVYLDKNAIPELHNAQLSEIIKTAICRFLEFSQSERIFILPVQKHNMILGHLVFEFIDTKLNNNNISDLNTLQPIIGTVILEHWIQSNISNFDAMVIHNKSRSLLKANWIKRSPVVLALIIGMILLLFVLPLNYTVGGEAEIMPSEYNFAFTQTEGILDKVFVHEGSIVEKGSVLAVLDSKELDFKITGLKRDIDMLNREMSVLSDGAATQTSKLAKVQLLELGKQKKLRELEYLNDQRNYLSIKAPVSGVVLTKGIETLSGKKVGLGEPFCELALNQETAAEIYVPDYRISRIKPEQSADIYLNSNPSRPHKLIISSISPKAEVSPRLGNFFRVKAKFEHVSPDVCIGMRGTGKINTGSANLFTILSERLSTKWNNMFMF